MAYDEIWVIGDTHLLSQLRASLEDLKDEEAFNRKEISKKIYILDNYEVTFGTFHHSWSFTTQIKGGLNYLLSSKWRLPNHILIAFSNDQIQESVQLGDQIYHVIKDIFKHVARAITERKVMLPKKARRYHPPIITVIRTVSKSERKQQEANFKHKRRTLNRAIQKVATEFSWRTINIDDILPKSEHHFDDRGEYLSNKGLKVYWKFLSENLRSFDQELRS